VNKRSLLAAVLTVPLLWALADAGTLASAAPVTVYTAAPTGVPGFESSMAFTPTTGSTLLAQLDNQQGSDADSTTYSQAFQVAADGTVDTISWWGTGTGQAGFMVALQDGVWGSTTSLPNGPVVEGTLTQLSVVPIAQVTETPATNGETRFQISVPATAVFASHAYRLSVTAVGGTFQWDDSNALGCCTGTSAINWVRGRLQSYLAQPNVSFSLDSSAGPSAAPLVTMSPSATSVVAGRSYSFTAAASGSPVPTVRWQRSADGGTSWTAVAGATSTTYSTTASNTDDGALFRAVFTNPLGSATTSSAQLTVTPMVVAPVTLPGGAHKVAYAAALTVIGGNAPYKWTVVPGSGRLPAGLRLNKSTGAISGTPKVAGTSPFTVQVVDTRTKAKPPTQDTATLALSITIS
jgi:hypothetical protein